MYLCMYVCTPYTHYVLVGMYNMKSLLFWDVMQRLLVVTIVSGQPIDPFFQDQACPLNSGRITCPETSVRNY